jgi:hypothetical protein
MQPHFSLVVLLDTDEIRLTGNKSQRFISGSRALTVVCFLVQASVSPR